MSHNATTVNGTPPSASGALTLSNAYFGVTTYPVITSLSTIVANVPVRYSIPMGRNSSYNILTTKQGTSAQLGPTLNVISTTYQGDWFDRITLPAGTWLIRANIAQDPSYSSTGSFCLVNFSTGARIGPVVSTRDAQRSSLCIGYVTLTASTQIAFRTVAGTVYKNREAGYGRIGFSILKVA